MKRKLQLQIFFVIVIGLQTNTTAQILNQAANWPNSSWIISGTFNSTPDAFKANPTTTEHFSFDDRGSNYGQRDNIIAESPVIDLSTAFAGGETLLSIEVQYSYRNYSYLGQSLFIEYWVDSAGFWLPWTAIDGNIHQGGSYCYQNKSTLLTTGINIASFSAQDLSNFKYRISYTDPSSGSFGWGFCFDSPTIKSNLPINPPNCAENPYPADNATDVPNGPINITWSPSATGNTPNYYKVYFALNSTSNLNYVGSFDTIGIYEIISSYLTDYYVKVIPVNLGGEATGCPTWHFTSEDEPPVPTNDICSGATPITVQPQGTNCANPITMNNHSATNSSNTSGIPVASCTYQDTNSGDLWYSFTAPASGMIKIINKWTGDEWFMIGFVIYDDCTASNEIVCGSLNDNVSGIYEDLIPGQTYYLRIFDNSNVPPWDATKYFCIENYTPPANPPINDECSGAIVLNEQFDKELFIATTPYIATVSGATETGIPPTTCIEGSTTIPNDDVWFIFSAETEDLFITIDDNYSTNCTVELFQGECGALTQMTCASGGENPTINATGLSIGTDYYIRVFSDLDEIPSEPEFGISVWTQTSNLGIVDNTLENVNIYPNPSKNKVNITSKDVLNQISIHNLQGQTIYNKTIFVKELNIDVSHFSSGYYIIKLASKNKTGIYRLLIK